MGNFNIILISLLADSENQTSYMVKLNIWELLIQETMYEIMNKIMS
jgi:hypothetical protein